MQIINTTTYLKKRKKLEENIQKIDITHLKRLLLINDY